MPRSRVHQSKQGGKYGRSCTCCDGDRTTAVEVVEREEGYGEGQVVVTHHVSASDNAKQILPSFIVR